MDRVLFDSLHLFACCAVSIDNALLPGVNSQLCTIREM